MSSTKEQLMDMIDLFFQENKSASVEDFIKSVNGDIKKKQRNENFERKKKWYEDNVLNRYFCYHNSDNSVKQYFKIDNLECLNSDIYTEIKEMYEIVENECMYQISIFKDNSNNLEYLFDNPYEKFKTYKDNYVTEEISVEEYTLITNIIKQSLNKIHETSDNR